MKALIFLVGFYPFLLLSQVFDVLETESFDDVSNLSTDGNFATNNNSCTTADMFTVSANHSASTEITNVLNDEVGSVFSGFDLNSATAGSPTELIVFDSGYLVTNNDEIGFAGNFALHTSCGAAGYSSGDKLEVYYSLDSGATWSVSPSLTLTASGAQLISSDGTVSVKNTFRTKEFSLGSGHSGKTIKIKVQIYGFTSGGEGFALDEFRLVTPRSSLICENFDNTSSLITSSGASTFDTPVESGTCDNNTIYDVSNNAATPTNITNCLNFEVGSVFVLNHRIGTSAVDGEELEVLSYTVTNNNAISFRGNFATFGSNTNPDNSVDIQYSTDNGSTYTNAFTLTGANTAGGSRYLASDGSSTVPYKDFITKGFPIGSGLNGRTIKIKLIFHKVDNNNDGIAFDEFCLEESLVIGLPIKLLNFNTNNKGKEVYIDWSTLTEINNDYFTIEKSEDAINFKSIGIIKGAGNSNDILSYNFIDYNNQSQVLYYRLKQTDYNGDFSYSKINVVDLRDDKLDEWSFYPNPANEIINLKGNIEEIELLDVSGNLIKQYFNLGSNQMNISINDVKSGIYLLKVKLMSGKTGFKKLSITHWSY
tara:strand:- start:436 stop:2217 length:1782 start_codon:yes stop_codon:yes gene_type:complete